MQEHEIHTGKDYIVKIANHEVMVKVLSSTCRGWVAKTTSGKFIPINSIERFVRQVAPAGELPHQTPAIPAEAENQETSPSSTPVSKPKNKLTMLDAAAKVLKDAGHPMKIKEILTAMEDSGLWAPGPGKTPDRTLIAGIGLEIRKRVKNRFRKTAPGTFEYIGG